MSGTPRRINTDRSLGTPSAGGGAEGGVPPKAPPPPPSGPAPQEDDGQSFFRPAAGEAEPPAPPRRTEPDPGRGGPGREPPRHSSGGGRRKKRRRSPLWLPLAIVLGCMALVGCGVIYAVQYVNRVQESIRPDSTAPSIVEEIQTLEEYKGDVVNILVCGIDYEEGRAYGDGSNDGMTDMILYCQFDIKGGALRMLQIPRNTLVTTSNRTITLSSGKTYKASNYQINSVALSNGGSIAALAEVIYDQYKLPVDYYVTIDMQSLKEIVNLFGGIEVYIPKDISYKGSTLEQGYRNLDGEAAEFFVRNRNYAQADIARLDMQRYFYQGLFARIRTANVWDLAKLAPVALKYVETNIPMDELISMGVSFLQVDSANIMMCKLPTYSAAQRYNDQSHLICDVAKTTDLLNEYFRTYGGPVYELDVPTLATVGESTDPNVQYMGQLDTEAEAGQAAG